MCPLSSSCESEYAEPLRAFGHDALRRLRVLLLDENADRRDRLMQDLMRVPPSEETRLLGQLVAICDEDRADRLEVLRGIRDALGDQT